MAAVHPYQIDRSQPGKTAVFWPALEAGDIAYPYEIAPGAEVTVTIAGKGLLMMACEGTDFIAARGALKQQIFSHVGNPPLEGISLPVSAERRWLMPQTFERVGRMHRCTITLNESNRPN